MTETLLALDRASARRVDADGHLHVDRTPISKANVCGYLGREVPGFQKLGLSADRVYRMWRHPDELEKAVPSAAGKPLFMGHRAVGAADHDHENNVGSVTVPEWDPPYVMAALDIWPQTAIDAIESKEHAEISSAYRYTPVMKSGKTPNGESYDGIMTEIDFSHVALVPEGRAGKDVRVLDATLRKLKELSMKPKSATLSVAAVAAQVALLSYAKPRIAQDAKLDLTPMFKGVNAKNMKAKAPVIAKAFEAALRPNLARDSDMDQADVQAVVEEVAELMKSESDDIAAAVTDPDPAGTDEDDADLRAMLKAKGYTDEEIDAICKKELPVAASAEDEEGKKAAAAQAADAAIRAATKDMVTKGDAKRMAEDAAKAAVHAAVEIERQRNRDLRDAEALVAPVVGKLAGAMDTAPDVFRGALKVLNVTNVEALPEAALRAVFDAHAAVKQAPAVQRTNALAADAALTGKSISEMFPDLKRLHG